MIRKSKNPKFRNLRIEDYDLICRGWSVSSVKIKVLNAEARKIVTLDTLYFYCNVSELKTLLDYLYQMYRLKYKTKSTVSINYIDVELEILKRLKTKDEVLRAKKIQDELL